MKKKIITAMLGIAMIFVAIPGGLTFAEETAGSGTSESSGSAEETVITPTIKIDDSTAYLNGSGIIYVYGSDFANVAALKISVIYDSSVITVTGAYDGTLVGSASMDINYEKVDGQVSQSIMSTDGMNGSGMLMRIDYAVKSGAEAGNYSLMLVVEEAYSMTTDSTTGKSTLVSITPNKKHGKLILKEQAQTTPTASFNAYTSTNSLKQGDSFDYYLRSYGIGDLAGGNFEFTYDRDVLELDKVTLGSSLSKSAVTSSVNTETAGFAKVSFMGTEALGAGYYVHLVTLKFTVKVDKDVSTEIEFEPTGLQALTYGDDSKAVLTTMGSTGLKNTVNITKKDVVVVPTYPKFSLEYETVSHGETFAVTAVLDGDSKLAAGDFTIKYDKDACVCTGVEACANETSDTSSSQDSESGADIDSGTDGQAATKSNSIIMTNPKFSDGTVKFSFVNTNGITEDEKLVKMTFKILKQSGQSAITASGTGTVDTEFNSVTLDYPQLSVDLSHYLGEWTTVKEATFDADGQMQAKCSGCDYVETKTIPKHLYGDVNRDGKVNFVDALCAKRYMAGWEGYQNIDTLALDVNCDGNKNPDDVKADITILERHIAGWSGYGSLPKKAA